MKDKLIGAGLIALALTTGVTIMGAGFGAGLTVVRDPGTKWTLTKTSKQIRKQRDSRGFCVKADPSNADTVMVAWTTTASATVGIPLKADDSICEPFGDEAPYAGVIAAIAVTTAGTPAVWTLDK